MKLNQFEIDVCLVVINAKSNKGSLIKDMRLINVIEGKLLAAKMEFPKFAAVEGESQQEMQTRFNEHQKQCQELELVESDVDLTDMDLQVIKIKMSSFNDFSTDKAVRERILTLADKLGL